MRLEQTFRRLDAPELLAEVTEGATYVDGRHVKSSPATPDGDGRVTSFTDRLAGPRGEYVLDWRVLANGFHSYRVEEAKDGNAVLDPGSMVGP